MQSPAEAEEEREKRKKQEANFAFYGANVADLTQTAWLGTEKHDYANCKAEQTTMTAIITQPTDSCKISSQTSFVAATEEADSGIASTSSGSDTTRLSTQPENSTENFAGTTVAETSNLYSAGSSKQSTDYGCADCGCCATANEADIMELCAHLCFCVACFESCNCGDCSGCADCDCSGCS